jgi:AcrR family transcriptional regulator
MLQAAEAVVLEEGAGNLTLDAVARRAGVSKGGVIYNFHSKDALLEAMVDRLIEHSIAAHQTAIDRMPDQPGRALRAYVQNSLRTPDENDRVSGALLAIIANSPQLLAHIAAYFLKRFQQVSADVPMERAALVHMATEGLWMMELMQTSPLSKAQRTKLAKELLRLCDADEQP